MPERWKAQAWTVNKYATFWENNFKPSFQMHWVTFRTAGGCFVVLLYHKTGFFQYIVNCSGVRSGSKWVGYSAVGTMSGLFAVDLSISLN